ncbi:SMI1/KNR4 family protein SUKH-1 [Kitasatospora viridis]|uniref:SMI1/KNR4 family protein SUKH-1 n=2 Tax=Kitasatospora viridis TaxID=281105 RepID=A0A561UMV4_9ACTN|nr:SMI1/KNR4 family protein SUKH-1 [Kitasatospora viridis]
MPAPAYAWRGLLQRWSDEWLDPVLREQERPEPFPADIRAARWLGTAGAGSDEIAELEERLGVRLPPSYRQFLRTSNGWLDTTGGIKRLLPTREVGWTGDIDPELVSSWVGSAGSFEVPDEEYFVYGDEQDPCLMRAEYLPDTLKISHTHDATDVYLLNPHVVTPDGEWEAWYLAHWLPGATRYRSFWDLMNDEYKGFCGE